MTFNETDIDGCFVFEYKKNEDSRGDFSRIICVEEIGNMGIYFVVHQSSLATNKKANTARGLHYQKEPHGENKIITCVSGSIDVFVMDLRGEHGERTVISKRLNSNLSAREMVYVPDYCASGYITLEDNSSVLYYMDQFHYPESARVISLLQVGIDIPNDAIISEKDAAFRSK